MTEQGGENENWLWLQFKKGNKDAFAALYKKHSQPLIAYGLKLCPDKDILKDQIQELFVELWQSKKNLAKTDSVKFYLFKALRYKLIRLEKYRHQTRLVAIKAGLFGEGLEDSIETSIVEKEIRDSHLALLRKAVHDLSIRQQEVIHLRFYQGFSNEQIAVLMGMNYQSVSNLLYRALCSLKERMKTPVFTTLLLFFLFH